MADSFLFLRPPGSLPEKEFKARCISCGRCMVACTFRCLKMTPDFFFGGETPKVFHHQSPCHLCMKCGPACPTGALLPVSMEESDMGTAAIDPTRCLSYRKELNLMCWTCYERCPLRASAIVLKNGYLPQITDKCVGCGVCEYVCPVKAVSVTPARFRGPR